MRLFPSLTAYFMRGGARHLGHILDANRHILNLQRNRCTVADSDTLF